MSRTYALTLIALGAMTFSSWVFGEAVNLDESTTYDAPPHIARRCQLRDEFLEQVQIIADGLRSQRLTLPNATRELIDFSARVYPWYLKEVRFAEKGAQEERVARNLVRHFETEAATTESSSVHVERLRREFEQTYPGYGPIEPPLDFREP